MLTHMRLSRRAVTLLCYAAIAAACGRPEDRAGEETAAAVAAQCTPEMVLSATAGKWTMRSMDLDGGNVLEYELIASGDCSDWSMVVGDRPPIPLRVVGGGGDSLVIEASPYESFLRPGVQLRQRDVYRLQDGKLVSTTEAWYMLPTGDSLVHRRSEGTRAPEEPRTP
jgi:hypothetical protein